LRPAAPAPIASDDRQATGREKHDQKITVYLSAAELLDLEHARLVLRRFGLTIDRGRLVREAIAILLADLDARGEDSVVARRIGASLAEDTQKDDTIGDAGDAASRLPSLLCPRQAVRWWQTNAARTPSRCTSTSSRGRSICCSR
jgi:hypothetical protein